MSYGLRHGVFDFKIELKGGATFPTSGLLGRWQLDGSLNDSYGSYPLTQWNSGIAYDTGLINQAIKEPASGGGGRGGRTNNATILAAIDSRDAFTVSMWWKYSGTVAYSRNCECGDRIFAIAKTYFTGVTDGAFGIFSSASYATKHVFTSTSKCDGNWHHVVGGYDGNNLWLYVDNISIGTMATTQSSSPSYFYILDSNGSYMPNGLVDQVYLYNKTLSASEISQLYNGGAGI